jgi:hypothetical protein
MILTLSNPDFSLDKHEKGSQRVSETSVAFLGKKPLQTSVCSGHRFPALKAT